MRSTLPRRFDRRAPLLLCLLLLQCCFHGQKLLLLVESSFCYSQRSILLRGDQGQQCLFVPATATTVSHPPLIVLPGLAQGIPNWEHHVAELAQERNVLIYEAAGLGPHAATRNIPNVTLAAQAEQLLHMMDSNCAMLFPDDGCEQQQEVVDVAGFSLGGRIAMAAACLYSHRIRKMHLTGVSARRSDEGYLQLRAWKDHLQQDNLRAFAWSALLASYQASFLRTNEHRLETWVQSVCDYHTTEGLLALLEQTHPVEDCCANKVDNTNNVYESEFSWSVESMARQLAAMRKNGYPHDVVLTACQLCVGQEDAMAPAAYVRELADLLLPAWDDVTCKVIPGCGHAVPMEAARPWRRIVLDFLNA